MTQGVTYRIDCLTYQTDRQKTVRYYGESARTLFDRGAEHWSDWKKGKAKSVLTQHQEEQHQGEECSYQMNMVKSHRLALGRQAHEAVLISRFDGEELLNRRGEWGSNLPPTLVLEGEEEKKKEREREQTLEKNRTLSL